MKEERRYIIKKSVDVLAAVDSFCRYYELIKGYIEKGKVTSSLDRGAFALPQFILNKDLYALLGNRRNSMSYAYGPESGDARLRQKICELENLKHETSYTTDQIVIVPGAWSGVEFIVEEIVALKKGHVRPTTIAVIGPTHYQMFHRVINVYGANVIAFDFVYPEKGSTPRTKQEIDEILSIKPQAVFVTNPNNPNGEYFPADILRYLVCMAAKKKIYVIIDEIQDFLSEGNKGLHYGSWIQSAFVIRVDSFSKKRGIAEYRTGWVIASNKVLGDRLHGVIGRMSGLMGNAPRAANTAIAALLDLETTKIRSGRNAFKKVESGLRKREALIRKRLANMPGVVVMPREACINITIQVASPRSDMELARALMDEGTLIMPCGGYGYSSQQGVMRITFAERWEKINHSMRALKHVLKRV